MRIQVLLHAAVLCACLDRAGCTSLLELRDDNVVCEGNPQYSQCGDEYPSDWCCGKSTACLPVNSTTTTVVLCCPDGDDCSIFQPISCGAFNNSLSPVHVLGETAQLLACGGGCCPPGYNCTSEVCTIEASLGLTPTSLPRPAEQKTVGARVGVGVGVTLGVVAVVVCLIWFIMRRRRKEAPSLKSMISGPKRVAEEEEEAGREEDASLVGPTGPPGWTAYETGGQFRGAVARRSSSDMMPPPLMQSHTNTHATTPAQQKGDVKGQTSKDLPRHLSPRSMQQQPEEDDEGPRRLDQEVHPALRANIDSMSSMYDRHGHGHGYGSGYDQR